jgi:hypothetical protein
MMLSTSKYLTHPRLRDWAAMILLRSNGDYFPAELEMRDVITILDEIRDHDELGGDVNVLHILGSLRYTVRTMLYYPQGWQSCVKSTQRGMRAGEESDALFMAKYEPVFAMTIAEARAALGVRGVEDIDTTQEGAIWAGRHVA